MLTNRIGRSLVKRYLLHINNHERGDASREDNQHGDDVDHGVALQLLPVVVVTCWAAVQFPVRSSVRRQTLDELYWTGTNITKLSSQV